MIVAVAVLVADTVLKSCCIPYKLSALIEFQYNVRYDIEVKIRHGHVQIAHSTVYLLLDLLDLLLLARQFEET